MEHSVNIHDAKTNLSRLLAEVEKGEEVIISRANKPIARLVPYQPKPTGRKLGEAQGMVKIMDDFDDLTDGFLAFFKGYVIVKCGIF